MVLVWSYDKNGKHLVSCCSKSLPGALCKWTRFNDIMSHWHTPKCFFVSSWLMCFSSINTDDTIIDKDHWKWMTCKWHFCIILGISIVNSFIAHKPWSIKRLVTSTHFVVALFGSLLSTRTMPYHDENDNEQVEMWGFWISSSLLVLHTIHTAHSKIKRAQRKGNSNALDWMLKPSTMK